jgi:hypothetical protein
MVTRRTAKSKGSALEYDVHYSLKHKFEDLCLTKERGFQRQFDICSEEHKIAIECKRLAGTSWNDLVNIYCKLDSVAPREFTRYVVVKTNRQPALVFFIENHLWVLRPFEDVFQTAFVKHPSSRPQKNPERV